MDSDSGFASELAYARAHGHGSHDLFCSLVSESDEAGIGPRRSRRRYVDRNRVELPVELAAEDVTKES